MKLYQLLLAGILSLSIIVSAYFIVDAINAGNTVANVIEVVGSEQQTVESDLIVWNGKLIYMGTDLISGYALMKAKSDEIEKLFVDKGIPKNELKLSAVDVNKDSVSTNNLQKQNKKSNPVFRLSQSISLSTKQLKVAEEALLLLPDAIKNEVVLISNKPLYYFTQLDEIKLSLLAKASQNGLEKAKTIAENSKVTVGKLIYSKMGSYRISDRDVNILKYTTDSLIYSTARMKSISITVSQKYQIK